MPTNQIAAQAVEDLRAELSQAKQRETELTREASDLPNQIREAARQVVREKAQAARAGGSLLAVAAESEVDELRSRQDNLDYEMWAAKLYRAEMAQKMHEAEEKAADLLIPDAENKHRAAERALEDARAEEDRTHAAKERAYGARMRATSYKRAAEKEIKELEARYPGA